MKELHIPLRDNPEHLDGRTMRAEWMVYLLALHSDYAGKLRRILGLGCGCGLKLNDEPKQEIANG